MELKTSRVTGNLFRTIKIKDCITLGWNDGLEKLLFFSKDIEIPKEQFSV